MNPPISGSKKSPLLAQRAAFWGLFPLVAPQGLWLRRTAPRFADAAGPATGVVGTGPTLRLLALGDSIVAGVGAPTLEEALVGQFARALARRASRRVEWAAVGQTGARSHDLHARLVGRLPDAAFDLVFVSMGVNDVTGLVRSSAFVRETATVIDALRAHAPDATILVAGLPPLGGFPLLPQPLRTVLGLRARTFDRLLEQVAATRERCRYVPTDFDPTPDKFADDGYHPSAASYAVWGEGLTDIVLDSGWLPPPWG